jgi:peroxiredoxin
MCDYSKCVQIYFACTAGFANDGRYSNGNKYGKVIKACAIGKHEASVVKQKPIMISNTLVCLIFLLAMSSCKNNTPEISYQSARMACDDASKKFYSENSYGKLFRPDCMIGASIPDSLGRTLSGENIDDDYFKNKITLINFWFESCPGCVAEIPALNNLVEQLGQKEFNYLGVGRETDEDIHLFLGKHPWKFEQLSNGKYWIENVFKPMWGYPMTMVVNEDGKIVSIWHGIHERNYDQFVGQLDSLRREM